MNKEYIIDLIKWFIGSVVIVVITLIIDTGFKEREAGIKEMEVYDKYVGVILEANNIEQRWKLCEYFSIVTPTERLRNRWVAYKDSIEGDYILWKKERMKDSVEVGMNNAKLVGGSSSDVEVYEKDGFDCLLNRDYDGALKSFISAENVYPGYHNCYEIERYLKSNGDLNDKSSPKWNVLYKKLISDWSWGMEKEYKDKFSSIL